MRDSAAHHMVASVDCRAGRPDQRAQRDARRGDMAAHLQLGHVLVAFLDRLDDARMLDQDTRHTSDQMLQTLSQMQI